MKYIKFFKNSFLLAMVALATTACQEEVNIGNIEAPEIGAPGSSLLYVTDSDGSTGHSNLEFRNNGKLDLTLCATTSADHDRSVNFVYDGSVLDEYNKLNNTSFEAVPQKMVAFSNSGAATIASGKIASSAVSMTVTSDGTLDCEKVYAVPLRIVGGTNGSVVAESANSRLVFVKDLTNLTDCHKTWIDENGEEHEGIKIFSVMEVNDTNPLNNLRYTLEKSGKYMVDALVMFSGNINYNAETGRVYFYANPNVQHLLDNREKYLKPLQDRGMKVIMGVMCNHDRACISNLAPATAKLFAKELKALCDAYQLDGIFWDDEYCSPITPPPAGFESRNRDAWSRLAYEVWKLQPERWNVAYGYSMTHYANEVDGVQPGTFINYCLPDYDFTYRDYTSNYPGMTLSQMGGASMEFAQGRWWAQEDTYRNMRNEGYGAMMVFAMDPYRSNASGQDGAMSKLAHAFYDDEVVCSETKYPKDW